MTCRQATGATAPADPWQDGWPHARVNSLACFDLAISELRKRLLEQRAGDEEKGKDGG